MANPYSLRNASALLGPQAFRGGWNTSKILLAFWCPFQIVISFTDAAPAISTFGLLFAVLALWFFFVPREIRKAQVANASTAGLTGKVFLRHILPALWTGITVIAPAASMSFLIAMKIAMPEMEIPGAVVSRSALIVAVWLAGGSLLNLLVYGFRGGWRVSLINVAGMIVGLLAALLSLVISGAANMAPAIRFRLATFIATQFTMLPMGIVLLGWAVYATVERARAKQAVSIAVSGS